MGFTKICSFIEISPISFWNGLPDTDFWLFMFVGFQSLE